MHDALVIVADAIIGHSAIIVLVEIVLLACKSLLKFSSRIVQKLSSEGYIQIFNISVEDHHGYCD